MKQPNLENQLNIRLHNKLLKAKNITILFKRS
jgi:hypothetical protein